MQNFQLSNKEFYSLRKIPYSNISCALHVSLRRRDDRLSKKNASGCRHGGRHALTARVGTAEATFQEQPSNAPTAIQVRVLVRFLLLLRSLNQASGSCPSSTAPSSSTAEFLSRIVPSSEAKEAQQRANDDFYLETLRSSQTVAEARQRRECTELEAARQARAQEKQAKADARKKRTVSQLLSIQLMCVPGMGSNAPCCDQV